MNARASVVVLLSASLDSQLIVAELLAQQSPALAIHALHFSGVYTRKTADVEKFCRERHVPLTIVDASELFHQAIVERRFGDDKLLLDLHISLGKQAKSQLDHRGGDGYVISGDIAGQRKSTQTKEAFETIDHHAKLAGRWLRPHSLPLPQEFMEAAQIDPHCFAGNLHGRSRQELVERAAKFGITTAPGPSHLTPLYDDTFVRRLLRCLRLPLPITAREVPLLEAGRVFLSPAEELVVIGRSREENEKLLLLAAAIDPEYCAIFQPANFVGAVAVARTTGDDQTARATCRKIIELSKSVAGQLTQVRVQHRGENRVLDTSLLLPASTGDSLVPL